MFCFLKLHQVKSSCRKTFRKFLRGYFYNSLQRFLRKFFQWFINSFSDFSKKSSSDCFRTSYTYCFKKSIRDFFFRAGGMIPLQPLLNNLSETNQKFLKGLNWQFPQACGKLFLQGSIQIEACRQSRRSSFSFTLFQKWKSNQSSKENNIGIT